MRRVSAFQAVQDPVNAVGVRVVEEPLVAAVVAIATLLVLGSTARYAWHRRKPGARLRAHLAAREEVAVLMHPNPDPDAMACAMAVNYLAEQAGTDATLQYPGEIRHQENRAFRNVLGLDLERVETDTDLAADSVVLVDHDQPRGFTGARGVDPDAVVDHHPGNGRGELFTDLRPEYGACASILAEYFEELGAERYGPGSAPGSSGDLTLPTDVATGLAYGIQSDTTNLSKGCTSADLEAYSYLYPAVDEDQLDRIANPLVDAEVIEVKATAIDERECRPPYAVSDVGSVNNLDAIPQAADELMQVEDIAGVVVLGEKDGTIHLSGRARDDRVHMGRTLRAAVEDIPMANAGGHARMGGGRLSVAHMNGIGPSDGLTREELHEALFDAMAGET